MSDGHRFYRLEDDLGRNGRWYLDVLRDQSGIELDDREFQYGKRVDLGPPFRMPTWHHHEDVVTVYSPLAVALYRQRRGKPTDLTFTNTGLLVGSSKVQDVLQRLASNDVQLVPVTVESQSEEYAIINAVHQVDCIDHARSEIEYFEEGNDIRPGLAGEPEMVSKLVIDPTRTEGHHFFRLRGWDVQIVVSEVIRAAFQEADISGAEFFEATL